jgi:hypothetical protein
MTGLGDALSPMSTAALVAALDAILLVADEQEIDTLAGYFARLNLDAIDDICLAAKQLDQAGGLTPALGPKIPPPSPVSRCAA